MAKVERIDTNRPERGSASIFIDLTDSKITVQHGSEHGLLASWDAQEGDWDKLWEFINKMVDKRDGFRLKL